MGPRAAIISITLGMSTCAGLTVRQRFSTGPSGSSLTCTSGFTGTGFQLHVGSMVISSWSELRGTCVGHAHGPTPARCPAPSPGPGPPPMA